MGSIIKMAQSTSQQPTKPKQTTINDHMIRHKLHSHRKIYDRHITRISLQKYQMSDTSAQKSPQKKNGLSPTQGKYHHHLAQSLQCPERKTLRQFAIQKTTEKQIKTTPRRRAKIQQVRGFKVQGWKDNYYTNLLDWNYNNFICAAHTNEINLYNLAHQDEFQNALYHKYQISKHQCNAYITSIKCSPYESKISIGYTNGKLVIYDYLVQSIVLHKDLHQTRIATLDWNDKLIFTGSKDKLSYIFDTRSKNAISLPKVHVQQICGIKSHDNYIATGGNDNQVFIYDMRKLSSIFDHYAHKAAIKAITWSNSTLVTGGGTADKTIKLWNNHQIKLNIDTGSQICSLLSSKTTDEIVSCQGFSLNQIIIWDMNGNRRCTIHGHQSRVLYSALSPNGQYVATGAGDMQLKIWKLFPKLYCRDKLLHRELR